jgi:acyl-CoA synthetase (AMP-forming)/AMP-acid ligase II
MGELNMGFQDIVVTGEGAVRTIKINRPSKLNAIRGQTIDELEQAVGRAGTDAAVGVIVPKLVGRTSRVLGAQLSPCWGMTEAGITTVGRPTDSEERRTTSDGAPVPGVEVRVVDDAGNILPPNCPGNLQLRASGQPGRSFSPSSRSFLARRGGRSSALRCATTSSPS